MAANVWGFVQEISIVTSFIRLLVFNFSFIFKMVDNLKSAFKKCPYFGSDVKKFQFFMPFLRNFAFFLRRFILILGGKNLTFCAFSKHFFLKFSHTLSCSIILSC